MASNRDILMPFNSLVGQRLADLEFIELLAESETTAVYRARQHTLNRQVAVKVLSPEEGRDAALVERFTQAALAAAAVEHPNIVQVFQAAEARGYHYVVMELVHGESLESVLEREGRLPADRALPLMKQAAAALAAAHAAGVLHGDIQPSNLLVTPAGQLKIADFSLARCSLSDMGPAAASTPPSHPLYFPPEAARGRRLDARSDLYLLGAAFYHALAGRPPFEANTVEALALKHVREEPRPLDSLAPKAPLAFCHLIHHLLRRDPDQRFQKAEELVAALERIEAEVEAERHPPPLPSPAELAARTTPFRRPGLSVVLTVGAVVVLVLIAYVAFVRRRSSRPSVAKPTTEITATPDESQSKPTTEVVPEPPVEPKVEPEVEPTIEPKVEPKVEPKAEPEAPAWQKAWVEVVAKAKALADFGRFGEASACYQGLLEQRDDAALRERVAQARAALAQAARAAFRQTAERSTRLAAEKRFDAARAELQAIIGRAGVPEVVGEAQKLLAAIESQEKAAEAKEAADPAAVLARQREAEAVAARALESAEALARSWDFAGAAAEVLKLRLTNADAAALVAVRADELNRLALLKAKIINHVVTATPKIMKSSVFIPGLNGPLTDADQEAIVVSHPHLKVKEEPHRWVELGERAARALALLAVGKDKGDDWLALGLLDIAVGNPAAAEEDFAKARTLGTDTTRHLAPLAKAALANAEALIAKQDFRGAATALDALEASYGDTAWLKLRKEELAAARSRVKLGLAEAAAAALLTQAAECLRKSEPYEARRLLTLLKNTHPTSKAVTDASRKPSFAELVEAVAKLDLGAFIVVRKDGTGDAKSIVEAVRAATARTRIEVQDSETYPGNLVITEDKAGLHLRAKAGCWPVVAAPAVTGPDAALVDVRAEGVTLEGLVLALGSAKSPAREGRALWVRAAGPFRLRQAILAVAAPRTALKALSLESEMAADCDFQGCVFVGPAVMRGNAQARDAFWLAGRLRAERGKLQGENLVLVDGADLSAPADLRLCTVTGPLTLRDGPNTLLDSVLSSVDAAKPGTQITRCLFATAARLSAWARLDRTSSFGNPQFAEERAFDFRLRPNSPGRNGASDKGDQGCRFTPASLELVRQALELRRKGILAF